MKQKILFITFLMGILFSLASCESTLPDGLWDPMKWKTSVKVQKDKNKNKYINVPTEGGTYVFHCKNYSNFWISGIDIKGKEVFDQNSDDFKTCKGDWGSVECKSNILTVIVSPKSKEDCDTIKVGVTAGDIFDSFVFRRQL